jgi:hypothetical protein
MQRVRRERSRLTEGSVDRKGFRRQEEDGPSQSFIHGRSLRLYGKRGRRMCDQLNGPFDARLLNPDGRTAEMSSFFERFF